MDTGIQELHRPIGRQEPPARAETALAQTKSSFVPRVSGRRRAYKTDRIANLDLMNAQRSQGVDASNPFAYDQSSLGGAPSQFDQVDIGNLLK